MSRRSPVRPPLQLPTGGRVPLPSVESTTMFDWVGWHTVLAIAVGLAIPPAIAFAVGLFGLGQSYDYSVQAAQAAHPDLYQRHYEERAALTRSTILVAAVNGDPTLAGPWADGVRDGWMNGAIDAVTAMRDALKSGNLGENAFEHDVLDELERTLSSRQ